MTVLVWVDCHAASVAGGMDEGRRFVGHASSVTVVMWVGCHAADVTYGKATIDEPSALC